MDRTIKEQDWLTARFNDNRAHLAAVAYRILGSRSEADDAVQESWLRLHRSNVHAIDNLSGWLTTVVARVCLDMLRVRKSRREESLEAHVPAVATAPPQETDPVHEVLLADSVGLALRVVLETLSPAERVAFVLHDVFDLPFDAIAPIVGRSSTAARQLASRARRRVQGQGTDTISQEVLTEQKDVVVAFLCAARAGNFEALLAVLDPEVEFHADDTAVRAGGPKTVNGAQAVARIFAGRAQAAKPALVDGAIGIVVAPRGQLFLVIVPTITNGTIVRLKVTGDLEQLRKLKVTSISD